MFGLLWLTDQFALPSGIIGSGFIEVVYQERKEKEAQKKELAVQKDADGSFPFEIDESEDSDSKVVGKKDQSTIRCPHCSKKFRISTQVL